MKVLDRQTVYDGFYKVRELTLQGEDQTLLREQLDRGDSVAALVFDTKERQMILTRQFRAGPEKLLSEVVAGSLDDPSESPRETIHREIREEIGYAVDRLQYLHEFYTTPGGCSEKIFLYLAEVSEQVETGGGVEEEQIERYALSVPEFQNAVFEDGKTVIAQYWWNQQEHPLIK